jgi:hypothetical protein
MLDFSEAMLAASAAAYDPAAHEAPLVVGHPTATAPAYGWVRSMRLDGADLVATCDQVNPDFSEMVKAGAYKKVSASWYGPANPANPKPGEYYLRHVGFLGAQPPAIKGLRAVHFAEDDGEVLTVEFAEVSRWQRSSGWRAVAQMFRGIRDMLVERDGVEKADALLPAYSIDDLMSLSEAEANADTPIDTPAFSQPTPKMEPAVATVSPTDAAVLAAKQAELAKQIADFSERQTSFRRDQHSAFLDDLVAQGRPLPMAKADMLNFMEAISPEGMMVDFAEGATVAKKPAVDLFKAMLKGMPATVEFGERAPGRPGEDVELDPQQVARLALDFQESEAGKGIVISTTEAVAHVKGATK